MSSVTAWSVKQQQEFLACLWPGETICNHFLRLNGDAHWKRLNGLHLSWTPLGTDTTVLQHDFFLTCVSLPLPMHMLNLHVLFNTVIRPSVPVSVAVSS